MKVRKTDHVHLKKEKKKKNMILQIKYLINNKINTINI